MINTKKIEIEKLRDWFIEKYDWECYKQAEKEFNNFHSWWRRTWGFKEKDRLWLIKRTKEILNLKWKEKTCS